MARKKRVSNPVTPTIKKTTKKVAPTTQPEEAIKLDGLEAEEVKKSFVIPPVKELELLPSKAFEKEYFDNKAKGGCNYQHKGEWQRNYAKYIDRLIGLKDKTVIDLGCAYGSVTSAFVDQKAKCLGVDISEHASKASRFRDFKFIHNPSWALLDIENNTADLVHCMYVMNCLSPKELESTFSEIKRVSKDGALVFIIMNITPDDKQVSETHYKHSKSTMDSLAKKNCMKNGTNAIQPKLIEAQEGKWNFIEQYKWQVLLYKVVKE